MKMNRKPDEEQDEGRARGRKTQNRKNVTKIGKRKEARKRGRRLSIRSTGDPA